MARTVMYSPTEIPVDAVLARSVSTTAIALAIRPIPRPLTELAATTCHSAPCQAANPVYPASMAIFHASLGENVRLARGAGDVAGEGYWSGLVAEFDEMIAAHRGLSRLR